MCVYRTDGQTGTRRWGHISTLILLLATSQREEAHLLPEARRSPTLRIAAHRDVKEVVIAFRFRCIRRNP